MDPYKLVGVSGRKRHGKDTIADHLVEKYGFTKIRFADAVREVALDIDPIVSAATIAGSLRTYRLSDFVTDHGWEQAKEHPEVRRTLQRVGTEAIRKQMPDFWTTVALEKAYHVKGPVVICDVRFKNEVEAIDAWEPGAPTIRVVRPGYADDGDTHISETELDDYPFEHVIYNDGSIEDLHKAVDAWIR